MNNSLVLFTQPDFPKTKGFTLLTRFMQANKGIKVSFKTQTGGLLDSLNHSECDLIFSAGLNEQTNALITDRDPYLAILPAPYVSQLGLSMTTTINLAQLAESNLLLPSSKHPLRQELQAAFAVAGQTIKVGEEDDSLDLRLTKVAQYLGATIAPQSSLPAELPAGCQLFGIAPALVSTQGFLAASKPSPAALTFLNFIKKQSTTTD